METLKWFLLILMFCISLLSLEFLYTNVIQKQSASHNYFITCWQNTEVKLESHRRVSKFWDLRRNLSNTHDLGQAVQQYHESSCPMVDFLAEVDESIRSIEPGLLCDEFARNSDILCRIYLRQVGLDRLERLVCKMDSEDKVPKIVFFVTFGDYEFLFRNYLVFVAAQRHVAPVALYVVGDQVPRGVYWEMVMRDVPGIRFVYRVSPTNIAGKQMEILRHRSDIVRLQMLLMSGGIYLDTDMVILRSVDSVLDNELTMGLLDNYTGLGTAFITVKRNNSFIKEWYSYYKSDYRSTEWGYNSMNVSNIIYTKNTSRVVLISDQLYRPNWFEPDLLVNESVPYNWTNNYGMHIWGANPLLPKSPDEVRTGNSTVCQVFRYILYGDPAPITETQ